MVKTANMQLILLTLLLAAAACASSAVGTVSATPVVTSPAVACDMTIQIDLPTDRPLIVVAFGDSITNGGQASTPELVYWRLLETELNEKGVHASFIAWGINGGKTTHGVLKVDEMLAKHRPNVVLIAFGMNDQNVKWGTDFPIFVTHLDTITKKVLASGAVPLLLSAPSPAADWSLTSGKMEAYANATRAVAIANGAGYADVYGRWVEAERVGVPVGFVNKINHPNDAGHRVWYEAVRAAIKDMDVNRRPAVR